MASNEDKFKEAWTDYLADDSNYNWQRWDKLKQVMFATGKTPDEVETLMNEAEGREKFPTQLDCHKCFQANMELKKGKPNPIGKKCKESGHKCTAKVSFIKVK